MHLLRPPDWTCIDVKKKSYVNVLLSYYFVARRNLLTRKAPLLLEGDDRKFSFFGTGPEQGKQAWGKKGGKFSSLVILK